jgi:hypothetical protein
LTPPVPYSNDAPTTSHTFPRPEDYWLVRFLFQRALAVIYLAAFLVAANQFRLLAGEDGLLPIGATRP